MTRALSIPDTVTLHVPFRIVKRGGRREMQLPVGASLTRQADSALVKAVARAFRWKRMLDSGDFNTIGELAQREGITVSYLTRILRLTLLAPEIVEAILDVRQGSAVRLLRLREPFPSSWERQSTDFKLSPPRPLCNENTGSVPIGSLSRQCRSKSQASL